MHFQYVQWHHAGLDSIESNFYKLDLPKIKGRPLVFSLNLPVIFKSTNPVW